MINIIKRAAKIVGDGVPNYTGLASAIGCHRSSLYTWTKPPIHYCAKIVKATGGKITLKMLRGDIYK